MTDFHITIEYPVNWNDAEAARKDAAEQVFYVSPKIEGFAFEPGGLLLDLSGPATAVERAAITQSAQTLLSRCAEAAARTKDEVLEEFEGELTPADDPFSHLLGSGQAHFNMSGVPVFEGDFLALLDRLDVKFRDYALSIGSVEQAYPTTVPTESLLANGYLKSFPQHARLVGTIHQDFESLTAISEKPEAFSGPRDVDPLVSGHAEVLSPTVCYHCFERYRTGQVPARNALITAIAKCHRHEGRNTQGLTRLRTYTMREIIYFGTADFVREQQEQILSAFKAVLSGWGMKFRVAAASDPFFATSAAQKKEFQRVFRLKYEVQAWLPADERWISVASFNNHQGTLVSAYGIGVEGVNAPQSGCFGVGYERLAYAVVAQKGVDPASWPAEHSGRS